MTTATMKETLLDTAERLVRMHGYSAFSYADLAAAVGIRKASIHHHFPAKADLGAALVDVYIQRFREVLARIDHDEASALGKLARYAKIYEISVQQGLLCLCGMLSSEMNVLPDDVRARVKTYFKEQLRWLGTVLKAGLAHDEITFPGTPERAAEHVLSTVQGACLVAWGAGDQRIVARATDNLLASLKP